MKRVRLSASRTATSTLPNLAVVIQRPSRMPKRERQAGEHEQPGARRVGRQREAEHVAEVGQAVVAAEAHLVAEEGEHQRVGQRLGDDREVDAGDAARKANQPKTKASRPGTNSTIRQANQNMSKPCQNHGSSLVAQEHHEVGQLGVGVDAAVADLAHHVHAHRVAAEREEGAVAERQDAGVAPDEVERHREQRVGQVLAEQRDDVARHVPGLARARRRGCRPAPAPRRRRGWRGRCRCAGRSGRRAISGLHRAAALREQAARPLLDEQDDEDEDQDLAEHRAGVGLEELVGDPEREGRREGAPEVAGAAEDDDEERVDDVALPEVRRDVVDLAERDPGEPGDAGAEPEGQRVDAGRCGCPSPPPSPGSG